MGRVDVDAMLGEMTPRQFEEWLAYWRIEPWDVRLAAASIAQHVTLAGQQQVCAEYKVEYKPGKTLDLDQFILGYRPRRKRKRRR